jgi:predicted nucleic acid-binding protein
VITAVDTSVLLDVFTADPEHGEGSRDLLKQMITEGQLIACEVIWAEVTPQFPTAEQGRIALEGLGVLFQPMGMDAALVAGDAWRDYRARGGARGRVIADFLIGAHAMTQADRLFTRDRGFHRECFAGLEVVDPTAR